MEGIGSISCLLQEYEVKLSFITNIGCDKELSLGEAKKNPPDNPEVTVQVQKCRKKTTFK